MRRKPDDMATSKEFERKHRELSERIRMRLTAVKPTEAALVAAGTSSEALRKMSFRMFIRLGELANVLETTPNWLLGIPEGDDREAVRGVLEAIVHSSPLPEEKAESLVESVLKALDSPAIRKSRIPPRDSARTLALDKIQRFLHEARQRTP